MNQVVLVGKIDHIDYGELVIYLEVRDTKSGDIDIIPVSTRKEIIDMVGNEINVIGVKAKISMVEGSISIVLEKVTVISDSIAS